MRAAVTIIGGLVLALVVLSDGPATGRPSSPGMRLLEEAVRATAEQPYAGRQFVEVSTAAGDRSAVVDVVHDPGVGSQVHVVPTASAPGGTWLEPADAPSLLRVLTERALVALAERYTARVADGGATPGVPETVAGRPALVVELVRGDGTLAARLWLDRETRLPLQREVYDADGRLVRASGFTMIDFDPPPLSDPQRRGEVRRLMGGSSAQPLAGPGRSLGVDELVDLHQAGWVGPGVEPETLDLVDARWDDSGDPVLHLSYTDGISTVSVFEQEGRLDPSGLEAYEQVHRAGSEVWVRTGVPERVVWSSDGRVYTVVSDDPAALDDVLAALPHVTDDPGVLERLRRGLARVLSWLNPFG